MLLEIPLDFIKYSYQYQMGVIGNFILFNQNQVSATVVVLFLIAVPEMTSEQFDNPTNGHLKAFIKTMDACEGKKKWGGIVYSIIVHLLLCVIVYA